MRHERALRLSRRIWGRHPSRPCRFLFSPAPGLGLVIEGLNKRGEAAYVQARKHFGAHADLEVGRWSGALLVDDAERYVFCGPKVDVALLEALAAWAAEHLAAAPGLAGLIDASVATVDIDLRDAAAIAALDATTLDRAHRPDLWFDLLVAGPAEVARTLAAAEPGTRLWYEVRPLAVQGEPPLFLQAIEDDPNRQRIEHLSRQFPVAAEERQVTGVCKAVDGGGIQFVSDNMSANTLRVLARWVREHVGEHPGLARLANCSVALVGPDGVVRDLVEAPAAWDGIEPPVAPATLDEAAQVLDALAAEQRAWFWMTAHGNGSPFLSALPVGDDPAGAAFLSRATRLYQRFPDSGSDAVFGTVQRLASGRLLFSTGATDIAGWPRAARSLADADPRFAALSSAAIVTVDGDRVRRAAGAQQEDA